MIFDEIGLARHIDIGGMMFLLQPDGEFLGVGDINQLAAQQDTTHYLVPMLAPRSAFMLTRAVRRQRRRRAALSRPQRSSAFTRRSAEVAREN